MSRQSHSAAAKAITENSPRSTFCDHGEESMTEMALDTLNLNLASQKEWSIELQVHPSMVSMWINGTKSISEDSAKAILTVGEMFALRQAKVASLLAYEIRCYLSGRKP